MDDRLQILLAAKNVTGPAFRSVREDMARLKKSAFSLKGALGALGGAFVLGRLANLIDQWERLAGVQEKAEAGVAQALRSMGRYSDETFEALKRTASGLQEVTTFGDEAILSGIKFLLTYKDISDDVLPRTIRAMTDLAALQGGDMKSAANMLGKASMGLTGELRRVGITVDQTTFKSEGFLGVLREIESQVKGQARALAGTNYGKLEQFKNIMGDLQEDLGRITLQLKVDMLPTLIEWVKWLDKIAKAWQKIVSPDMDTMVIKHLKKQRAALQEQLYRYQGVKSGSGFLDEALGWIPGYITQEEAEQGIKILRTRIAMINKSIDSMRSKGTPEGLIFDLSGLPKAESGSEASSRTGEQGPKWWPAYMTQKKASYELLKAQLYSFHDVELEASRRHMEEMTQVDLQAIKQEEERQQTMIENAWQYYGALEEANRQHAYTMNAIDEDRARKVAQVEAKILAIKQQTQQSYLNLASATGNAIIAIWNKDAKKQFAMQKAFQVGLAVMSAYLASNQALASPPGPPATIPLAAAVLKLGLVNAAVIAAQSIGQYAASKNSGGSLGSGGGATPTYEVSPYTGIPAGDEEKKRTLTIHIYGDILGDEAVIDRLAEKINEGVENRNVRIVASDLT